MREVDPKTTSRAMSYELYIDAPMPMVTLFKTLDITPLVRLSKRGHKLNMLLCWCALSAAKGVEEFSLLPVGKALVAYDCLGVNVIVNNAQGGLSSCDLPDCPDWRAFEAAYLKLTQRVQASGQEHELPDAMILGTSALPGYDIDGAVNFYNGVFNNPFLIWGKYVKQGRKCLLKVSFQFHHVQMDGQQACRFLDGLQNEIKKLSKEK